MKKILLSIFIFILILVGIAYHFRYEITDWLELTGIQTLSNEIKQTITESEFFTSNPLLGPTKETKSYLTVSGVVLETNLQRELYKKESLNINPLLNLSAEMKVEDMFQNQYFAHISPDGVGPSGISEKAGYKYIIVGENLALGNFLDDQVLVQAWMDSPGHRENILRDQYTEIGVAVKKGTYQGKNVWMAVQFFGRPASDCTPPDEDLGQMIVDNKLVLEKIEEEILDKKEALESNRPGRRHSTYEQKVDEYNFFVDQYNELIRKTENVIKEFNKQITIYNKCLEL